MTLMAKPNYKNRCRGGYEVDNFDRAILVIITMHLVCLNYAPE